MNLQQMPSQSDAGKSATATENGEHTGKQSDGQFLKRGTCVNI
jgi:hypothetical protein